MTMRAACCGANRAAGGGGVYLYATDLQQHDMAPIKQDLIRRRVVALQQELAVVGIPLLAIEADCYSECAAILRQLAQQGAVGLYAQTEYELREQHRDLAVTHALGAMGVPCFWFDSQCVMPPGSVRSKTRHL